MLTDVEKAVLLCHIEKEHKCDECIFEKECGTESFKDVLSGVLVSLTSSILSEMR